MNMKYRFFQFAAVILICIGLTGCRPEKQTPTLSLNLVTSVEVNCRHHQRQWMRTYTQTDKIDIILHYLHKLRSTGTPSTDPEQFRGDRCQITVQLSNGQQHIYRLQGDGYLSVDLRPWQTVNSQQASVLYHLVSHIPGDIRP